MDASSPPALQQVLVGHLSNDAGRHAHGHGARRQVAATTAPAATKASSPTSTPGRIVSPGADPAGAPQVGAAQRLAGRVAAHRVVVGNRHPRAEEDVVLDGRAARQVTAGLHADPLAHDDAGIDRDEAADGRAGADPRPLADLGVVADPRPLADLAPAWRITWPPSRTPSPT